VWRSARLLLVLLAGLLWPASSTWAAGAAEPGSGGRIPQGAAVWFACTQPVYSGPAALACPRAYDPRYAQTLIGGFDRMTPENEFKMAYLEPNQGDFSFALADQLAAFAQAHGKTVRGHTLVWAQELPAWVSDPLLPWSRDSLTSVLTGYVESVVSHFAQSFPGVVTEWDVVNEPLDASGEVAGGIWDQVLGPGYISLALKTAHAADPAARLLINELGAEEPGPKSLGLLRLAEGLKAAGVPLDGIGLQAHVTPRGAPSLGYLLWLMKQYAAAGLNVEFTELDVGDDLGVGGTPIDQPLAKEQVYLRFARACRLAPNCTGLTVWGVADPYSWLGPDSDALLYDSAFQPKPETAEVRALLASHVGPPRPARARRAGRPRRRRRSRRRAARLGGFGGRGHGETSARAAARSPQ
jgi:endo-1,4-beta-xylanase